MEYSQDGRLRMRWTTPRLQGKIGGIASVQDVVAHGTRILKMVWESSSFCFTSCSLRDFRSRCRSFSSCT